MDQDLEIRLKNLDRAPRCGALTRAGGACQRPAIRGHGGQQYVRVEHVHVADGGQAVIGNVPTRGDGDC
jgi:hypothetical protein